MSSVNDVRDLFDGRVEGDEWPAALVGASLLDQTLKPEAPDCLLVPDQPAPQTESAPSC